MNTLNDHPNCQKLDVNSEPEPATSAAIEPIISTPADHKFKALIPVMTTKEAASFATRINAHLTEGVAACVEAGRELVDAKSKLRHGEFQGLFEPGVLRVDQRTAEMLMNIAKHDVLSKSNNYSSLPAALNTLYALSRLPARTLRKGIEKGTVTSTITIREAKALLPRKASKPVELESGAAMTQAAPVVAEIPDTGPGKAVLPPKRLLQFFTKNRKQTLAMLAAYPVMASILQAHLNSLLQEVIEVRRQKKSSPGNQLVPAASTVQPATEN